MIIENIGNIPLVPPGPVPGLRMRNVAELRDAALWLRNGRIEWVGPRADLPAEATSDDEHLDAAGGCVIPGLIDCHTHIPFAGERRGEFVRRIGGETYLSIMQSGGGIRVSTAAVRAANVDELVAENLPRLARMLAEGVTACEGKSGYGLTPDDELKQLRAIKLLATKQPVELIATYLGAHAIPAEFEGRAEAFIDVIADADLLKKVADEKLARFCDVFCDRGAFDVPQARRVLEAGAKAGLRPKMHADELAQIGASRLAGELRAISADHLETIDDGGIAALKAGGTIAVVLPGTSFFLGIHHADARKIMNADVPLALATDCNPGSSHIESLPLVMNIACCQLRMLPLEVLVACTANAAAAISEQGRLGAMKPGYAADLTILDAADVSDWMYTPGRNRVRTVIKAGRIVYRQSS
ncbi:MAG: imidazolonepropionase [Phycisphaerales bacterium]|nr:imidazolonepropionase [Phycisphaerales bacterium]